MQPAPGLGPEAVVLADRVGSDASEALRALLVARAVEWARAVCGPDHVRVIEAADLRAGSTDGGAGRPLFVVAPELPAWRPALAEEALGDLQAGCPLSIAPIFSGGYHLLAFGAEGVPADLGPGADVWQARAGVAAAFELAEAHELEIGMLRGERGLRTPEDRAALRVDPLTDGELRGVLG